MVVVAADVVLALVSACKEDGTLVADAQEGEAGAPRVSFTAAAASLVWVEQRALLLLP